MTPPTQAGFDLSVTIPNRGLPPDPSPEDILDSGLRETFLPARHRHRSSTCPAVPSSRARTSPTSCRRSRRTSGPASIGASSPMPGSRSPVGRASSSAAGAGGSGPAYYFVHDVPALEEALAQLRTALVVGTIVLILARPARGAGHRPRRPRAGRGGRPRRRADRARRPVGPGAGHLGRRVRRRGPSASTGWRRPWPTRSAASRPPRPATARFVADVAHELRTPLAALVAEASILREHLDDAAGRESPGRRAAGRPTSGGCGRSSTTSWRSRASTPAPSRSRVEPVDLGASRPVGRRGPAARGVAPSAGRDRSSSTATRDGSSGSSATCSTTPGSMPPARRSTCRCRPMPARSRSRSSDRRSRRPARPPRAHLRALLQGRPVAPRREQRAGPRDRRRTRRAARRLPHRREPGGRRPAHRAPAACDLIVTPRRRGCDAAGGCWDPDPVPGARAMKRTTVDHPRRRPRPDPRRLQRRERRARLRPERGAHARRPMPAAPTSPRPPAARPSPSSEPSIEPSDAPGRVRRRPAGDDRRDDDRAGLLRARWRARQRRAGARPAGRPQERGGGHRGDERAAGGARRPRKPATGP